MHGPHTNYRWNFVKEHKYGGFVHGHEWQWNYGKREGNFKLMTIKLKFKAHALMETTSEKRKEIFPGWQHHATIVKMKSFELSLNLTTLLTTSHLYCPVIDSRFLQLFYIRLVINQSEMKRWVGNFPWKKGMFGAKNVAHNKSPHFLFNYKQSVCIIYLKIMECVYHRAPVFFLFFFLLQFVFF